MPRTEADIVVEKLRRASTAHLVAGGVILLFCALVYVCGAQAVWELGVRHTVTRVAQAKRELLQLKTTTGLERDLIGRLMRVGEALVDAEVRWSVLLGRVFFGGMLALGFSELVPAMMTRRRLVRLQRLLEQRR